MNLWDRIKQFFGSSPPAVETKVTTATVATKPEIPFIIPPDMLNSISLSTDLTQLHFVNNDRLVSFDLDNKLGITIGLLDGQLAVVKPSKPSFVDGAVLTGNGPVANSGGDVAVSRMATGTGTDTSKKTREIRLDIRPNTQFTATYNSNTRALAIIGATDIISTITVPDAPADPSGNCTMELLDLSKNTIQIKRIKDQLIITSKER